MFARFKTSKIQGFICQKYHLFIGQKVVFHDFYSEPLDSGKLHRRLKAFEIGNFLRSNVRFVSTT